MWRRKRCTRSRLIYGPQGPKRSQQSEEPLAVDSGFLLDGPSEIYCTLKQLTTAPYQHCSGLCAHNTGSGVRFTKPHLLIKLATLLVTM